MGFSCDGNIWRTDKQSSGITFERTDTQSSGFNFQQSNWQKDQFNTDLLKQKHIYLYRNLWNWLNRKVLIKLGENVWWGLGKLIGRSC
jgi:hypothetical protein